MDASPGWPLHLAAAPREPAGDEGTVAAIDGLVVASFLAQVDAEHFQVPSVLEVGVGLLVLCVGYDSEPYQLEELVKHTDQTQKRGIKQGAII